MMYEWLTVKEEKLAGTIPTFPSAARNRGGNDTPTANNN
jgi:hypothetical protein